MYAADAIVTGTDIRQRPWGFAQTLRDVLVRSSGDPRLKCDPRTAELAVHADRFVACFNYVDMMAGVPLHGVLTSGPLSDRGSLLRQSGLAQAGEIGDFVQSAHLRQAKSFS
jgi:hypothetical protein